MTPEEFISDKTGQEYNDHTPLIIDHKRLKRWLDEYAQQLYYKGYSDGITGAQSEPGN